MTKWELGGPNKNQWIDYDQSEHMARIGPQQTEQDQDQLKWTE